MTPASVMSISSLLMWLAPVVGLFTARQWALNGICLECRPFECLDALLVALCEHRIQEINATGFRVLSVGKLTGDACNHLSLEATVSGSERLRCLIHLVLGSVCVAVVVGSVRSDNERASSISGVGASVNLSHDVRHVKSLLSYAAIPIRRMPRIFVGMFLSWSMCSSVAELHTF